MCFHALFLHHNGAHVNDTQNASNKFADVVATKTRGTMQFDVT